MSYNATHARTPIQKLRLWWIGITHKNRRLTPREIRRAGMLPRVELLALGGAIR